MPLTVAIIHARGGSKRLPRKNVCLLGGKPLLAYPIELCREARFIDRVIVSTDDDEIMVVARDYGAEIPFRRPEDISEDVPSELVTEHALKFLCDEDRRPDFVVTLTPATPFTKLQDLTAAYQLLIQHPDWDAVTAVRSAVEHPEWILREDPESGRMETIFGNPLDGKYNVSQSLDQFFYPTGAFWINRAASFLAKPSLYGNKWGAIRINTWAALDIDTADQLRLAQEIVARGLT
jgi:CMP-N,N'-diacetyllegionaminic acid synthase